MTTPSTAWIATGIYWHQGHPVLAAVDDCGTERERSLAIGDWFAVEIGGPRRCIGVRADGGRCCPFGAPVPEHGPVAQCPGCAAADSGQQLARDQRLDERTFGLYLALASPGLPKIGLTARGGDRLAEQGAWAFTWLTHGPLIRIRAMEQAIARTGVAAERYQRATKITAWATRSDPVTRHSDLHAAYTRITEAIPWPGDLPLEHCQPIDHAELYGLDALPARLSEVTALRPGAVIVGTTRCLIGRELVLETSAGPMLLDTRLLCGWPLRRPAAPVCTGLTLAPLDLAGSSHDQTTLF